MWSMLFVFAWIVWTWDVLWLNYNRPKLTIKHITKSLALYLKSCRLKLTLKAKIDLGVLLMILVSCLIYFVSLKLFKNGITYIWVVVS